MRFFVLASLLLLSVAFAAPLADEAAIDALVETTVASEEEAAPVEPKEPETPAEEEEKPEEPEVTATEAPAAEEEAPVEPAAEETEPKPEAETDADDEDDESESSESEEKTPEVEAPKEEEAAATEAPAASETETDGAEAAAPQTPVESTRIPTGATATVEGVTIRFSLQATWKVKEGQRRGYVIKVTNGSEKDVCGVTFSNNAKSTDIWNLAVNDDGSFSTKDLHLTPGASANQFGYVSAARSQPTILAVEYC